MFQSAIGSRKTPDRQESSPRPHRFQSAIGSRKYGKKEWDGGQAPFQSAIGSRKKAVMNAESGGNPVSICHR